MTWLGLAALLAAAVPAFSNELRVGRAAVKITPPIGVPMAGYYSIRLAEGVHDELYARAVVLQSGEVKAALVACDLGSIDAGLVEAARKLIEGETGIPRTQVMISATHSHTGPLLSRRFLAFSPGSPMQKAEQYLAGLPSRIAESVKLAHAALQPAHALAGSGREESISYYRRFLMKDGSVRTNPGKMNPEIVQPMGEIDPEVAVVRFDTADERPLATLVNFALHLDTVGGTRFSADYPYTLGRIHAKLYSPDMLTQFTIAAAGNINHVDVRRKEPQKGPGEARRIGTILAGEVIKTMERLTPVPGGPLRIEREVVHLPLPPIAQADLDKARRFTALFGKTPAPPFLDLVHAFKVVEVADRKGAPLEAEVQIVALGDRLAWVGLPGEIFVELGTAIKKASPFPQTIVVALANGAIRYVPTRKAFQEGGYEPTNSLCAPGGGEALADTAIRLLARAHRRPQ